MRLIYFGTGSFALPTLQALSPHIVLTVTQPDRPSGRGFHLQPSLVKVAATELGIPVRTPERSRSPEFVEELLSFEADALLVASYGQILSQAVLDSAKKGGINLHGSILPQYRGAAPIQRCILNGESQTGITLMQMDKGMDTGDMIHQISTDISPDETYPQLQVRLAFIAAEMAVKWMPEIIVGNYARQPQDAALATLAPKIEKEEGELVFDREATTEYNRFRALTDNPGAFLNSRLGRINIYEARTSTESGLPGEVLPNKTALRVGFVDGALDLYEIQLAGKKRMTGRDFANGARLRPGDSLRL